MSRAELLSFEKYKQLEAEGAFVDTREQYLLSALCRLHIWYLSFKGSNSMDEMAAWIGYPSAVHMHVPTEEELHQMKEKRVEHDKKAYRGLLALAKGSGVKIKKKSRQQFFKEMEDVYGE